MINAITALAPPEVARLDQLEATIERGLSSFVEVGNALAEIRDGRLYRAEFGTFEEYCRGKWGMGRSYAYEIMESATVAENVRSSGHLPSAVSQARPLASLTPERQIEVWQTAVNTAPNGKVTAAHVQEVVTAFKNGNTPHVSFNSGNNEWYTPPEYIAAARAVMGDIDCDPASSELANEIVGATTYFTVEDDGLAWDWQGRVWMNPPYAQPAINQFCEKFADDYRLGVMSQGCVLVNNATETRWYQRLLEHAAAVCFITGRIKFIDCNGEATGAPLQGQTILYFGENIDGFAREFSKFGKVLYG